MKKQEVTSEIGSIKLEHSEDFLALKPIPAELNPMPLCFNPEKDNPYPLCVGNGGPACPNCVLYVWMEDQP